MMMINFSKRSDKDMKPLISFILFLLLPFASLFAGEKKETTYGFPSVLAFTDARSYSFGNLVAAGNDWNSYYWNPALIGQKCGFGINYDDDDYGYGLGYHALTLGYGHSRFGSFAVFYRNISLDKFEITTIDHPEGTGEFYYNKESATGISYANSFKQITAGFTVKRLYGKLDKVSASAFTMDLGALTRRSVKLIDRDMISEEVTVAFCASDILVSKKPKYGPSRVMLIDSAGTKFVNVPGEPFNIPESFRAGGTYRVMVSSEENYLGSDKPFSLAFNASYWNIPIRPYDHFSIGLECVLLECLSVSTVTANLAHKNGERNIGSRYGAGILLSSKRLLRTKIDSELRIQYAEIRAHGRKLASPITAGVEYRY